MPVSDHDDKSAHILRALSEMQLLISVEEIFSGTGLHKVIMPPLTGRPRPHFVPADAPAACLPLPPDFLRRIYEFHGTLTEKDKERLAAMKERVTDLAAFLKLEKMGLPRLKDDRMGLNRALAFGDGIFEALNIDYEKMDTEGLPLLWLWHDGDIYRARVAGEGARDSPLFIDGGGREASTLAGRLLYGLFHDFGRHPRIRPDRLARLSRTLGRCAANYGAEWFGRSFWRDGKRVGCTLLFPPGQLSGIMGGEARKWLEYCELTRRISWGLSRWIGTDPAGWMERLGKGDQEFLLFWKFAGACNADFFAGNAMLLQGYGPLAGFAATIRHRNAYMNEGFAQAPGFALGVSLRDEGKSTYASIGVLSGLPHITRESALPGLSFIRSPSAMEASVGALCPAGCEELVLPSLLKRFIENFPYTYTLPEIVEKGIDGFERNLDRLVKLCGTL